MAGPIEFMNTPEYTAYTKLTLVNRIENRERTGRESTKESISFDQFLNALKNNKVVNDKYARHVDPFEIVDNQINERMNGNFQQASDSLSIIEKAYEIGLADRDGILVSSFEAKA